VLAAVRAIYEPNSPTATKSLNGTTGKTIEWTEEISAAVLNSFKYTIATASTGDEITLSGPAPTGTTNTKLVVIDLGHSNKPNTDLPRFVLDNTFADGTNTRLAVNADAYLEFGSVPDGTVPYTGNLLVRRGGKVRETGTSGWGLGEDASISIVWGGNFAIFPGDRDGSAAVNQTTSGKMFDNWLIGAGGFITWDGLDGEANGVHIDIIQNNLRLHGKVTLARSLGTPYNIFLDQGSQLTIDVKLSGPQAQWPKGLWNNAAWPMSIKGVASTGSMPTIGVTTEPASTIIIKKGANVLRGFMADATSAITSTTDDMVLLAVREDTTTGTVYTSTGTTDVTTHFTGPIYVKTWKRYP
jgi:hypothetical protein